MTPEEKKERARIANRKFYEKHKEEEKARSSKWRRDNKEWYKEYVKNNRETLKANSRRYEYGLSQEEFNFKLSAQENKCAICRVELARPEVDHDHSCCPQRKSCGKCTRGLLCRKCNVIIGLANDSIDVLNQAIQYLDSYRRLPQCSSIQPPDSPQPTTQYEAATT